MSRQANGVQSYHMHFLYLVIVAVIGFAILFSGELLKKRYYTFRGERARKYSHILIGILAATWPFYLSWFEIRLISIALVLGVACATWLKWFAATREVNRRTYGELLFAIIIGMLTFVTESPGVYAVAMLHLALADGFAALLGSRWGGKHQYIIWGLTKSVHGTITFFIMSVGLMLGFTILSGSFIPFVLIAGIALGATLFENLGGWGIDNAIVPMFVAVLLNAATIAAA